MSREELGAYNILSSRSSPPASLPAQPPSFLPLSFCPFFPSPSLCWQPSPNKMQCLQQVCRLAAPACTQPSTQTAQLSPAWQLPLNPCQPGWRPWAGGPPPFRQPQARGRGGLFSERQKGKVEAGGPQVLESCSSTGPFCSASSSLFCFVAHSRPRSLEGWGLLFPFDR